MTKSLKISLIVSVVLAAVAVSLIGLKKYNDVFEANVNIKNSNNKFVFIPTGSDYEKLYSILLQDSLLIDTASFNWLAHKKNLINHVYPGRYKLYSSMNNNELINMFRSGNQTPVTLSFNKLRSKEQLASVVSQQIEADSVSIINILQNDSLINSLGLTKDNVMIIFIPNSYEFYWNSSAQDFINRMINEHRKFWTNEREKKARAIGLSKADVSILASIVEEETLKNDEKPMVAGVYINRIKKGIPLQADPTLKFALKNFLKRRITNKDKKVNSPYNTYKIKGIPPGPICLPSISSIDAVLNYSEHNYYYFCARDDFSGYHHFSKSLRQHNLYARKYHKALDKRKIYK